MLLWLTGMLNCRQFNLRGFMKVKKCEMFAFGERKQSLKLKHVRHLQEKLLFAGPANDSVNSNKQLTTALAFLMRRGLHSYSILILKSCSGVRLHSEREEYCTKWKT